MWLKSEGERVLEFLEELGITCLMLFLGVYLSVFGGEIEDDDDS